MPCPPLQPSQQPGMGWGQGGGVGTASARRSSSSIWGARSKISCTETPLGSFLRWPPRNGHLAPSRVGLGGYMPSGGAILAFLGLWPTHPPIWSENFSSGEKWNLLKGPENVGRFQVSNFLCALRPPPPPAGIVSTGHAAIPCPRPPLPLLDCNCQSQPQVERSEHFRITTFSSTPT